jgi:ParB family chromosome partitioning protein
MASKPLGRGLDALLNKKGPPAAALAVPGEAVMRVPVGEVVPCEFQPRKSFDEEALAELTASIQANGIMTPLLVRARAAGGYELIAGERRWRAAQRAGLAQVPVIVRKATDDQVLQLALIENLQREGLNPIEEAEGYQQLQARFKLTQQEIAERVGRPRTTVANAMRLLELDATVRGYVAHGQISAGHAKALLGLRDPSGQRALADRVIRQNLSVRATEQLVAAMLNRGAGRAGGGGGGGGGRGEPADPLLRDVQARLRRALGTKVAVHASGDGGRIEIQYFSAEDLNRLVDLMARG